MKIFQCHDTALRAKRDVIWVAHAKGKQNGLQICVAVNNNNNKKEKHLPALLFEFNMLHGPIRSTPHLYNAQIRKSVMSILITEC